MCADYPVPDPISPAWLTAVLRASGALPGGEAVAVEIVPTDAFNSHTIRLRVRYSADVPSTVPAQLVLKRNIDADWGKAAGAEEVKFYRLAAAIPHPPPIYIPCLAAEYDPASGNSYLVLQDISATHAPPVTRDQQISIVQGVPSDAHIIGVIDALAQHHAAWWASPLMRTETFQVGYWSRNAERFNLYLTRRKTSWANVLAMAGNDLSAEVREVYEFVLAHLPRYWQRWLAPRFVAMTQLTLMHGDAYFANFLCPNNKTTATPTYLLDWQSPSFDLTGHDLANLCATFWTAEQRREDQREEKILRRYLAQLHAHGVADYAWPDLVLDYRHGLIAWLLVPVQDASDGSGKDYWWPKMQCLLQAYQDWNCEALLT